MGTTWAHLVTWPPPEDLTLPQLMAVERFLEVRFHQAHELRQLALLDRVDLAWNSVLLELEHRTGLAEQARPAAMAG